MDHDSLEPRGSDSLGLFGVVWTIGSVFERGRCHKGVQQNGAGNASFRTTGIVQDYRHRSGLGRSLKHRR